MAGVWAFFGVLIAVVVALAILIFWLAYDVPRIYQDRIACPRKFRVIIRDETEPYGYSYPKAIFSEGGDNMNYYQTYRLLGKAPNGTATNHTYRRGSWVVKDDVSAFANGEIILERTDEQSQMLNLEQENTRLKGELTALKTDFNRELKERADSIARLTEAFGKKPVEENKRSG